MSTPLPPQSVLGFSIDVAVLLLPVTSLLVATTFAVLVFAHCNTYIRLLDEQNQAIWLSKNILPIIKEDDASQDAQGHHESASTEFSKSIVRCVSPHFPNHLMLTRGVFILSASTAEVALLGVFPGW